MDNAYDILKDIVHSSLLGQTSPLLLPIEQIKIVQNEVRRTSDGLLDPDFIKMQSVIVADPNDAHLLLVVINVAALSRKEVELVQLIAIPQFIGDKAYSPALDYESIVLDQYSKTFSVLTE